MRVASLLPVPLWFYGLAAILVLIGLAGSLAMLALFSGLDLSQAMRNEPLTVITYSAAPIVATAGCAWLALRQRWNGRPGTGNAILMVTYALIAAALVSML